MQPRRRRTRALGRLTGAVLGVWTLGVVYTPAVAATASGAPFAYALAVAATPAPAPAATVSVAQQPLTLQPVIPPNVTLMLDDSGSMAWDYMPDACYLQGVVCTGTTNGSASPSGGTDYISTVNNNAVIDASNNGVYYNPAIVYTPPPTASGGSYASYTDFTNVPVDGFGSVSGTANLTSYSNHDLRGEAENNSNTLYYSYKSATATYVAKFNQTVNAQYGGWGGVTYADQVCTNDFNNDNGIGTGPTFTGASGSASSGWTAGTCVFTYNAPAVYFQYSTGPAAGPTYTMHYVAPASQGCVADANVTTGAGSNCVVDSDTSGAAAPKTDAKGNALAAGTNIANWFAYYHTRIQMAKSGLMTAFSTINKTFRIGFGSIDGGCNNNAGYLPSASSTATPYTYTDTYDCGITGRNYQPVTNTIASAQPFGDGSSSGDQKNGFWNWVAALKPSGGTPLREALDAVGQYYQTSQPWQTSSTDTTEIACRQSYTILTTDGFWNESYTPSNANIQGASDANGPSIQGPNNQTYQYTPAAPYSGGDAVDASGNATASLADVAMYYWENDLQASLAKEVLPNGQDPAFWPHMTTFTMGLGFQPLGISGTAPNNDSPPTTADIASWVNDGGSATSKYAISNFSWPTSPNSPAPNSAYNISDLEHAGVNGHGGFYSATNPSTFASSLEDAISSATGRGGTGASLAANSTQLNNGTVAYQAKYRTAVWTGDLLALSIDPNTGAIASPNNASWSAAAMLPAAASRTIVTYNPSGTGTAMWPAFQDDSTTGGPPTLSTAELAALGSTSSVQATMVNYLRGDKSQEGPTYRSRKTPLGDIVDSQPVYSGVPNPNEFVGETFTGISNPTSSTNCDASFAGFTGGDAGATGTAAACYDATSRSSLVFVAANDGMLHALNASTGAEVYAYLPGAVITGDVAVNSAATAPTFDNTALATLANPSYGSATGSTPHQFYNDGELTIADVYFGAAWHTVLVGTTGRGPAEAVYALDITKATINATTGAISGITPLWERSARDGQTNSNYIGQMVGKPVIAKVQDGTANSDWQVLIGNGYNSVSGQAALLEFNVATGLLTVHTTTSITPSAGNGLAAPVAWMNDPTSGISTQAYAGDLQGQVWNFPLSVASTSGGRTPTTTYTTDPNPLGGSSATGTVVFTTPSQPITAGMLAGRDPVTGNVWVFFGTGRYLSSTDLSNQQVQSWYGVIAQSSSGTVTSGGTQSKLVQRAITYEQDGNPSANPPTLGLRTVTTLADGGAIPSGDLGWYMNLEAPTGTGGALVAQGERMVTPNQFQANLLLATTRIPVVTDICSPSGSGWVMAVNPFTGTNPGASFFLANGGAGTVTVNNKAVPIAGVGFSALPNNPIFVGGDMLMSFDPGTTTHLNTTGSTAGFSRVSWQELVNP